MIDEGMRALAEALRQQSAAYGFVARLLRTEVDDEALGRLRAMRFPAASGNDHLDAGYRGLCAYLNAGGERQRGDLAVDFLHTFIGVTQDREQVAFPYESVYTSPEHLLMQDARDEVLAAYRAAKVVLVDEACEPEDHLAFELEFMQLLGGWIVREPFGGSPCVSRGASAELGSRFRRRRATRCTHGILSGVGRHRVRGA